MVKILLIGAGVTSGAIRRLWHATSSCATLPHIEFVVWEKARGLGGRMSTSRNQTNSTCADFGAMYITQPNETRFKWIYEDLETAGVVRKHQDIIVGQYAYQQECNNFVAPNGMNSIIKFWFQADKPQCLTRVSSINFSGKRWRVDTESGEFKEFDIVVSTIPVPLLLQIKGNFIDKLRDSGQLYDLLCKCKYSSRFALTLYFSREQRAILDRMFPFAGNYVEHDTDAVVRFISYDSRKRRGPRQSDDAPSVVIHTSVSYGKEHIDDTDIDAIKEEIMERLKKIVAKDEDFPSPEEFKLHKWRFSQATTTVEGNHQGAIALVPEICHSAINADQDNEPDSPADSIYTFHEPSVLDSSSFPALIVAGDGLTSSTFEGCIQSADAAVRLLQTICKVHSRTSEK